ncbi:DUF3617 family protein [Pseudolabrys sp. FHR47]|uniref:DUF3617 domain-containing protein n=1 Tax=Pseudolabrys sp. FHR47 TaxID=2562284 RepID=UPI0010BE5D63|nr:DUF3617 family protein [Pseudolabrys sp. FHR47]
MRRLFVAAATCLAVSSAAGPSLALDMPQRKAGLWELKMEFVGGNIPGQTMKQCVDAATDKLMNQAYGGASGEACSKQDVSKSGNTMTIDSVCKFGPATMTSHAVVTGSFDSAYTVDVQSSRAGGPPMPGGADTHMRISATWLGACAAGQKPGDIVMPNGMTMNVLDMPRPGMPRR